MAASFKFFPLIPTKPVGKDAAGAYLKVSPHYFFSTLFSSVLPPLPPPQKNTASMAPFQKQPTSRAPVSIDVDDVEQRRELPVREPYPERTEQLDAEVHGTQGARKVSLGRLVAGSFGGVGGDDDVRRSKEWEKPSRRQPAGRNAEHATCKDSSGARRENVSKLIRWKRRLLGACVTSPLYVKSRPATASLFPPIGSKLNVMRMEGVCLGQDKDGSS